MLRKSLLAACAVVLLAPSAVWAQAYDPATDPKMNGALSSDGASVMGVTESGVNLSRATLHGNYFQRPGATIDDHDASLAACQSLAVAMDEPGAPEYTHVDLATVPNGYSAGGVLGLLVVAAIDEARGEHAAEGRENFARAANVENCMVTYGWNVRGLQPEEFARLQVLPVDELRAELAGRVGVEESGDVLLRSFGNELGMGERVTFGVATGSERPPSLSQTLLPMPDGAAHGARQTYREARSVRASWVRMMRGMSIVAVRAQGGGSRNRQVRFVRLNEEGTRIATDGQANSLLIDVPYNASEQTLYFEAPAGTWRLAEVVQGRGILSLCLAAPQFSVAAGEGVYAGSINLGASLWPDMGSEAAPPLTAAHNTPLRPAVWSQAGQIRCSGAFLYALYEPQPVEEPVLQLTVEAIPDQASPAETLAGEPAAEAAVAPAADAPAEATAGT